MSEKQVDARGLSCPQPVILTQKVIDAGSDSFEVLVSSVVSKENVLRCVNRNGLKAEAREQGEDFVITVTK